MGAVIKAFPDHLDLTREDVALLVTALRGHAEALSRTSLNPCLARSHRDAGARGSTAYRHLASRIEDAAECPAGTVVHLGARR